LPLEVVSGEIVAFLCVGSILLPINATKAGVLTRRLAEDGSVVGYGDPLFEYEPH
jgi:biotin carboxyl carrier protein